MLSLYGWRDALQHDFDVHAQSGLVPGRIIEQQRTHLRAITQDGERACVLAGRLVYDAAAGDLPVVGDWAALAPPQGDGPAIVQAVLPRRTMFARQSPEGVQIVAANLDVALIVSSLNDELNLRRLERYLLVARAGGAKPIIALTKADLAARRDEDLARVRAIAGDAPVYALSSHTGEGVAALADLLAPGETVALLGSSGVGKSTLLNALAGDDLMATGAISGDGKRGRHTTTHRALFRLQSGVLVLDSPGMRELGVWAADDGMDGSFEDIDALAAQCRFADCGHGREPGCAVQAALASGALEDGRWRSYQKLQRELAFEARKEDHVAREAHRRLWAQRAKANRARKRREDED